MPTTTPPVPPSLPPATPQQQRFLDSWNNQVENETRNESDSKSTSNAENAVVQSGSLVNVQQNHNNDAYYGFSNGTRMPEPLTLNGSFSTTSNGVNIATIGFQYNFGAAGVRKLAKDEVILASASKLASVCTGIVKAEVEVDYELVPELERCSAFTPIKKAVVDYNAQLVKQQATINALLLRIEQMTAEPTPIKSTY